MINKKKLITLTNTMIIEDYLITERAKTLFEMDSFVAIKMVHSGNAHSKYLGYCLP